MGAEQNLQQMNDQGGRESLDFDQLEVIGQVGRGAKAVVFHVRVADDGEEEDLALKVVSKAVMRRKNSGGNSNGSRRVSFEQRVLRRIKHPLLPRLRGVLETEEVVGYAMDYCPGGDLNSIRRKQTFSDDVIRFYAAELVLALEYLHSLGIVYRDLKPENILVQSNGHLMLVDFDLATQLPPKSPSPAEQSADQVPKKTQKLAAKTQVITKLRQIYNKVISSEVSHPSSRVGPYKSSSTESDSSGRSHSFVGTEEYVAPEMIIGQGHDFAIDWWCLGVTLYEMLYGETPFKGLNRRETFYRILTKSPDLDGEVTPLRDLIRGMLEKEPQKRISLEEIKRHDFFKGIDWDMILQLSRPPFIPGLPEIRTGVDGMLKGVDVENIVQGIFRDGEAGKDKKRDNCTQHNETKTGENRVVASTSGFRIP
ncbi:Serine/threonine-protein kinase OXI1-like protein [Drosera capensis]